MKTPAEKAKKRHKTIKRLAARMVYGHVTEQDVRAFAAMIQAEALRDFVERNRVSTYDEWEKGFTAALNVALSDATAIEQKAGIA